MFSELLGGASKQWAKFTVVNLGSPLFCTFWSQLATARKVLIQISFYLVETLHILQVAVEYEFHLSLGQIIYIDSPYKSELLLQQYD